MFFIKVKKVGFSPNIQDVNSTETQNLKAQEWFQEFTLSEFHFPISFLREL